VHSKGCYVTSWTTILQDLRPRYPQVASFKFPKKSKLSTFAVSTKERRREGFDDYLRLVSALSPQPSELFAFLDVGGRTPATAAIDTVQGTEESPLPSSNFKGSTLDPVSPSHLGPAVTTNSEQLHLSTMMTERAVDSSLVSIILVGGAVSSLFAFALRVFVVGGSLAGHAAPQSAVVAVGLAVGVLSGAPQLLLQKASSSSQQSSN
jgi:hypothetical protein